MNEELKNVLLGLYKDKTGEMKNETISYDEKVKVISYEAYSKYEKDTYHLFISKLSRGEVSFGCALPLDVIEKIVDFYKTI